MSEWFDGIGDFRDALAHRIPPYIPPYVVEKKDEERHTALQAEMDNALRNRNPEEWLRLSAEQEALGVFSPWLQHSFGEAAQPIYFHPQLLADFATVEALGRRMLEELRK